MQKFRTGDLSVGLARIGAKVRCIGIPDIKMWQDAHQNENFVIPQPFQIYTVRGNVMTSQYRGVLLKEVNNPDVSVLFMGGDHIVGEPFFMYKYFNFVS